MRKSQYTLESKKLAALRETIQKEKQIGAQIRLKSNMAVSSASVLSILRTYFLLLYVHSSVSQIGKLSILCILLNEL